MATTTPHSTEDRALEIVLSPQHLLDVPGAAALGRAVGTLLSRITGDGGRRIGVAFLEGSDAALRDGCVRGLILSGHHVVEVQSSKRLSADAAAARVRAVLAQQQRADGLHMTLVAHGPGPQWTVELQVNGVSLVGSQLDALPEIVADGPFAAGLGTLTVVDHEAPHTGAL